ncbi:helix-turn-helix transcriptional regulator [Neisseria sp.]|uniref:helix-turn-helix transcriptional regulator n=1 Tax=Neisseria sp. TaxID=192066 RepID=UPI0035A00B22
MAERNFIHRPNYGASGTVIQRSRLLYSRLAAHNPTVILVLSGRKILRWAGNELIIPAGRAVALAGWQTFDVLNEPDEQEGVYRAQWLSFEQPLIDRFAEMYEGGELVADARLLPEKAKFAVSFSLAAQMLGDDGIPDAVADTGLQQVLAWLHVSGCRFHAYEPMGLVRRLRKAVEEDAAFEWTAETMAGRLNMSGTTLRRRLAAQGTSFRALLIDVRMMRALTLLQVTSWTVAQIAAAVGYDNASRFTARFKERFGFVPTAVRDGEGGAAEYRPAETVNVGFRS